MVLPTKNINYIKKSDIRFSEYEKSPAIWLSFFECPTVKDYRTFVDDMYKVLGFVQWYEEWN